MEVLGIDVGGSGIKAAPVSVVTGDFIAERNRIATPKPASPKAVRGVIQAHIAHFGWTGPVGIAFPARIKRGVVRTATNIGKEFLGLNLSDWIEDETGLPTFALNDADAAGVAEMRFGAGRDRNDMVLMLTVGTGIGSALFAGGELVANTEFGHVDVGGVVGEVYASDRARKKRELTWRQWSKRFQKYLDRVEFLISPDLIIVGGGVSKPERAAEFMERLKTEAELVTASLSNRAGIVGASLHAANAIRARTEAAS